VDNPDDRYWEGKIYRRFLFCGWVNLDTFLKNNFLLSATQLLMGLIEDEL